MTDTNTHTLVDTLVALHAEITQRHKAAFELITTVRDTAQAGQLTPAQMTDIVYILRLTAELIDDMGAYLRGTGAHVGRIACLKWAAEQVIKGELGDNITDLVGEYATGAPDNSLSVKLPKQDENPEGYRELLIALGMRPEAMLGDKSSNDALYSLRPHWPAICEIAGDRAAKGLPPLPHVDLARMAQRNILKTRAKKGGKKLA